MTLCFAFERSVICDPTTVCSLVCHAFLSTAELPLKQRHCAECIAFHCCSQIRVFVGSIVSTYTCNTSQRWLVDSAGFLYSQPQRLFSILCMYGPQSHDHIQIQLSLQLQLATYNVLTTYKLTCTTYKLPGASYNKQQATTSNMLQQATSYKLIFSYSHISYAYSYSYR